MNRFDPETLAALADGTLPAHEAAEVMARIADDPAALAGLATQRAVVSALRSVEPPRLTDEERTTLRAAVADRLQLTPAPAAPAPTRRTVPWGAIGVAAATLAALVLVVPVVGLLDTQDDAGMDLTFAGDSTTTIAADARTAGAPEGDDAPGFTSIPSGGDTDPTGYGLDASTTSIQPMLEVAGGEALADELGILLADPEALKVLPAPIGDDTPCREAAIEVLGSERLVVFVHPTPDGDYLVFSVAVDDEGVTERLVAFAVTGCTPAAQVP